MKLKTPTSWQQKIGDEWDKPYFRALMDFLESEENKHPNAIFPPKEHIFRAFEACSFDEVKVVLLGQDPYPTRGHAHGLCFSAESTVRPLPKSLMNIYKEMQTDVEIVPRASADLSHWASQGVLMLNAVLTVREGEANSHQGKGWETFTDAVFEKIAQEKSGVVYILWGDKAIKKAKSVDATKNLLLTSPHPSPLSAYRGFFGSKPFSKTNAYLRERGEEEIEW